MNYLSVCSGIEAATVAWHPLGWKPFAFAEIEKFPSAVLAHHYPHVPNLGDMTKFKDWPDATVDVLVGGTPCQSFSVAGLRKGMADPRGNLALVYLGIADRYRPEWVLWENVPGVLSSNGGRDFGSILGGMAELGYGFAYRVLDAQYVRVDGFGRAVPQRRRRVFVVGNLGSWRRAAAVLFERESLSWDSAPRREAGQGVAGAASKGAGSRGIQEIAGTMKACAGKTGGFSNSADHAAAGYMVPVFAPEIARCDATREGSSQDYESTTMVAQNVAFDLVQITSKTNRSRAEDGLPAPTMLKASNMHVAQTVALRGREGGATAELGGDVATALRASGGGGDKPHVLTSAVRRLTPRECERLQGFPDDYTDVPWRGKPGAPDGPRYKALGNSMAVNVMRWIGMRIQHVSDLAAQEAIGANQ